MVDDYHLEILRGTDMMGRWYLADVEVKREIAERFTLFLGDDEMEFLADDALVFAYEGVTRMQLGWVDAKKRKRRHRRAAADAARRKDEAPLEPEPVPGRAHEPTRLQPEKQKKVPTSDLAKKLAAIALAEAAASGEEKRRFTWAEAEALELVPAAGQPAKVEEPPAPVKKARKRPTQPKPPPVEPLVTEPPVIEAPVFQPPVVEPPALQSPTTKAPAAAAPTYEIPVIEAVPPEAAVKEPPKRKRPAKPAVEELAIESSAIDELSEPDSPESSWPEPSWIAPPPARRVTVDLSVEEPVVTETPIRVEEPPAVASSEPPPPEGRLDEDSGDELTKRRQRRKSRRDSGETTETGDQPGDEQAAPQVTDIDAARGKLKEAKGSGHHPAETNVGLLAKLRRPPKADQEHVHTYQESRSSGGLTRRVCLECNHVSITSDD